jgi:hypothetical protein
VPFVGSPGEEEERERLASLEEAFKRGDYRAARLGADELTRTSASAEVKKAAAALRARTQPDPATKWLFLMALAVIGLERLLALAPGTLSARGAS